MQSSSPRPETPPPGSPASVAAPPDAAPPDRRWALAVVILRVAAEAGFFTVLYAAAAVVLEGSAPLLGPTEFVLLVGLGALVGTFARANPELGAVVLVIAVLGGGAASWLVSPIARALLADHFGAAMITHGIGWIGAFAVLRGSFIHGRATGAYQLEQLLRVLLPFVAVLWALATLLAAPPLRLPFAAYALWGSLALIAAGLAGIGLVRLRALHAGVHEIRVRQLWRWLVIAAAISVIPLSLPFVVLAGVPVGVLLQPLAGPVLFVIGILIIPLGLLVDSLVYLLTPFAGSLSRFLDELQQRLFGNQRRQLDPVEPSLVTTIIGLLMAAVVIAVLVAAAYGLARWLLSRTEDEERLKDPIEGAIEHAIVVPVREPARPRGARSRRRGPAHDAVTAYVSAIDELSSHPVYARLGYETPAQHSLRVRLSDMPGSADFSRLSADYQLARYAERPLSPREDRRALGRLDRLRHLLRGH